jgi:hypothetical protein
LGEAGDAPGRVAHAKSSEPDADRQRREMIAAAKRGRKHTEESRRKMLLVKGGKEWEKWDKLMSRRQGRQGMGVELVEQQG